MIPYLMQVELWDKPVRRFVKSSLPYMAGFTGRAATSLASVGNRKNDSVMSS